MSELEKVFENNRDIDVRKIVTADLNNYSVDFFEIVNQRKHKYRNETIALGRVFFNHEDSQRVKQLLWDIYSDEEDDFRARVQALYELLESDYKKILSIECTEIIINHLDRFRELCERIYFEELSLSKTEYYDLLKSKLDNNANSNKLWVYLIELFVLYPDHEDTPRLMQTYTRSKNDLIVHVAKRLLNQKP